MVIHRARIDRAQKGSLRALVRRVGVANGLRASLSVIGAVAIAVLVLPATTAQATGGSLEDACSVRGGVKYCSFPGGEGRCLLREWDELGTGGTSTITAPGVTVTSTWKTRVTAKDWTIMIRSDTATKLFTHYVGAVRLARGARHTFPEDTLNIPDRPTSNSFFVRVQMVVVYYSGSRPFKVDTGDVMSYQIWKQGAYRPYPTNIRQQEC
jgi:hypothetical protein